MGIITYRSVFPLFFSDIKSLLRIGIIGIGWPVRGQQSLRRVGLLDGALGHQEPVAKPGQPPKLGDGSLCLLNARVHALLSEGLTPTWCFLATYCTRKSPCARVVRFHWVDVDGNRSRKCLSVTRYSRGSLTFSSRPWAEPPRAKVYLDALFPPQLDYGIVTFFGKGLGRDISSMFPCSLVAQDTPPQLF